MVAKKILIILMLLLFYSSAYANSFSLSGNDLVRYMHEYEKLMTEDPQVRFYHAGQFLGFVLSTADKITSYKDGCIPSDTSRRQICRIVIKYINEHPDQLNLKAFHLVEAALKGAFPCQKQKKAVRRKQPKKQQGLKAPF